MHSQRGCTFLTLSACSLPTPKPCLLPMFLLVLSLALHIENALLMRKCGDLAPEG